MKSIKSDKFILMHILFGLLILGHPKLGVLAQPDSNSNDNVSDYDNYSDDEEIKSTSELPNTSTKSTMVPYFEVNTTTKFVQLGAKAVVLDCPIKNYDESKTVLWYKDAIPITNGQTVLGKAYQIDPSFNLTIEQVTTETLGSYYCTVIPTNVSRYVIVKIGEKPTELTIATTIATTTKSPVPPKAKENGSNSAQMLLPKSTIVLLLLFIIQKFVCQSIKLDYMKF